MRVETLRDGARFILPNRQGKPLRTTGILSLVFGLPIAGFMVFWMQGPIRDAMNETSAFRWVDLAFGLSGLLVLVPMFGVLLVGIGLLSGRSRVEIEVVMGELRMIERIGIIRWTWTRKLADVDHIVVREGLASGTDQRTGQTVLYAPGYGHISVRSANRKDLFVAFGYPLTQVRTLADQLAGAMNKRISAAAPRQTQTIAVMDGQRDFAREEQLIVDHPPKTDIVLQELPNGIAFAVPPAGVWRGSHGLFFVSIVWNVFMTSIFVSGLVESGARIQTGFVVMFILLSLAGVGLLLAAVNMGRRRALIAVADRTLTVRQIEIFRTREWRFDAPEVAAVRVGHSGMTVNDRPVMELQIVPRSGKKVGLLSQRKEEELLWLAVHLCRTLALNEGEAGGTGGARSDLPRQDDHGRAGQVTNDSRLS